METTLHIPNPVRRKSRPLHLKKYVVTSLFVSNIPRSLRIATQFPLDPNADANDTKTTAAQGSEEKIPSVGSEKVCIPLFVFSFTC